jgi:hypothetical protein
MKSICFGLIKLVVGAALFSAGNCALGTNLIMEMDYGGGGAAPGVYSPAGNGFTIVDEYGQRVNGLVQNDVASDDFGGTDWYNFHYGNNGEGFTPNVVIGTPDVDWRHWDPAGNLNHIAYPSLGGDGPVNLYWTFTADPGYRVRLHSTDLVRFNSTALDAVVNVYSGDDPNNLGPQLYSSGAVSVADVGVTVSPNVAAGALTLEFALPTGGGPIFNWAVDNIVFSQVPEPSGAVVFVACLAMLSCGKRRLRARRA